MSLRHGLLGLLASGPASGYDLIKLFDTALANVWNATQSQIYTELNKLAADELIALTDEGPRGRKQYSITPEGQAELRHWLTETAPQEVHRSEVLLRVFFLGSVSPPQAHGYLRSLVDRYTGQEAALREWERAIEWDDSDLSVYGRLVMEFGLRLATMAREWAEWADDQLGRPASGD
jgi:DNA-binding PadR family transcriptional regulator